MSISLVLTGELFGDEGMDLEVNGIYYSIVNEVH